MATVTLKVGREKSLQRRHPWIFSGAIERVDGDPALGATVAVRGPAGDLLGWGAWSPHSQIAVRVWTFDPAVEIGPAFFRERLQSAMAARQPLHTDPQLNAYRLVNAESDGLPGLVVDRYADYLVCQFLSAGADAWKAEIVAVLAEVAPAFMGSVAGIYERSDVDVRAKEGLAPRTGGLSGIEPPTLLTVQEYGCQFQVDVHAGHKTGFYLDQRENRRWLADYAAGAEVLNCFAYTGGFGVWALRGGAQRVTNVDTSAPALALAESNLKLNGFDPARAEHVMGDVFAVLRRYRDSRRTFDVIVLDPPKFAESRAQMDGATRGYKDINLLALKLLRPGGTLFTFSCSGLITPDLFQKIVAGAAEDAGREAQIVRRLSQGPDHPVALSFPEGEYLKGLVVRVGA